jgi:hypothetical protein
LTEAVLSDLRSGETPACTHCPPRPIGRSSAPSSQLDAPGVSASFAAQHQLELAAAAARARLIAGHTSGRAEKTVVKEGRRAVRRNQRHAQVPQHGEADFLNHEIAGETVCRLDDDRADTISGYARKQCREAWSRLDLLVAPRLPSPPPNAVARSSVFFVLAPSSPRRPARRVRTPMQRPLLRARRTPCAGDRRAAGERRYVTAGHRKRSQ